MSRGFCDAGFRVVAGFDSWTPAVETYRKNFRHDCHDLDLYRAEAVDVVAACKPDIIFGGPPCQDYSPAVARNGERAETKERAGLTVRFAEIVRAVRPSLFVLENVPAIKGSYALARARVIFRRAGYGLSGVVLDACYCGVPQHRRRFFLIGRLEARHGFLDGFLRRGLAATPMTVRDYLPDIGTDRYHSHPMRNDLRCVFPIDEPAPTMRCENRPVPPHARKHGVRALTTMERALIQTFPTGFRFSGSAKEQEKLIGNAVPVNLARHVASAVLEYETWRIQPLRKRQRDGQSMTATKRRDATRAAIERAIKRMHERGESVNVSGVAKAARVTRQALYKCYPDIVEILRRP